MKALPKTNLAQLMPRQSRRPRAGDIFCCLPPRGGYLFGRVVTTEGRYAEDDPPDLLVLYFYSARSPTKTPVPSLSRDALLLPPVLTNRLGFSRGYFEILEHRPQSTADVFPVHCFNFHFDDPKHTPLLLDEHGRRLRAAPPGVPIGDHGIHSYRSLDDAISRRLHLRLAPE